MKRATKILPALFIILLIGSVLTHPSLAKADFILELDASYEVGMLSLDFTIQTPEAATWANYLVLIDPIVQVIPLWAVPLPVIPVPYPVPISFPLPSMGLIGIYTGLFTAEGAQAVDLAWVDTSCWDSDGDGYQDETCGGDDCDDDDPAVNPGITEGPAGEETCEDLLDNDCDDLVDDDDPDCSYPILEHCEVIEDLDYELREFPRFNPALGSLISVVFEFAMSVDQDLYIENLGPQPTYDLWMDSYWDSHYSFPGSVPDPFVLEAFTQVSEIDLAAYDGEIDYDGPSGETIEGLLGDSEDTYEPVDLFYYIGTGTFQMTLSAAFSHYESGYVGSQPSAWTEAVIDVVACLYYVYEP